MEDFLMPEVLYWNHGFTTQVHVDELNMAIINDY